MKRQPRRKGGPPGRGAAWRSVSGRALTLGDDVNTDLILAGKYCKLADPAELGRHALEGVVPGVAGKMTNGRAGRGISKEMDGAILIAGQNFGCGSSREQAPMALKAAGVSAIVADSFGRIFFRNAVNLGILVLKCPGARKAAREGDRVTVDVRKGEVLDERSGQKLRGEKLPPLILAILEDGGLVPHLKRRIEDGEV